MPSLTTGVKAPSFRLPSTAGDVSLDELLAGGGRLVLAFYVEDGTPSCRTELAMLRDAHEMIREFRGHVLAVSADGVDSHRAFAERMGGLPFALASDVDLTVARAYGVVDEGDAKRSSRAVFVIDGDRTVLLALTPFQPQNLSHVEAIFQALGMET